MRVGEESQRLREALEATFPEVDAFDVLLGDILGKTLVQLVGPGSSSVQYAKLLERLGAAGLRNHFLWRLWWGHAVPTLTALLFQLMGMRLREDALVELRGLAALRGALWEEWQPRFDSFYERHALNKAQLGIASWPEDVGSPVPEHLGALTTLELPGQNCAAVVCFLEQVCAELAPDAPMLKELQAWLDRWAPGRGRPAPSAELETLHLLVIIEEQADRGFVMEAWHGARTSLRPLEGEPRQRGELVSAADLPRVFDETCKRLDRKLNLKDWSHVKIEVILPLAEIETLRPEAWRVQTRRSQAPLWAERACLCIRPLERVYERSGFEDLRAEWYARWQHVALQPPKTLVVDTDAPGIEGLLADSELASVQLVGAGKFREALELCLDFGYGVIVWVRQADVGQARERLALLLDQGHTQLLPAVHGRRRRAQDALDKQIVVLWDDPNLRPPTVSDMRIDG